MRLDRFKQRIDRLYNLAKRQKIQDIEIDGYSIKFLNTLHNGKVLTYIPSINQEKFHACDSMARLLMGPYASGKTVCCLMDIIHRACKIHPIYTGNRVSKFIIIRNTFSQLITTVAKTWEDWCSKLGEMKTHKDKTEYCYRHRFNDGKGIVELELLFLPLNNLQDFKKIKSLDATGILVGEGCELPPFFADFMGRLRYPEREWFSKDILDKYGYDKDGKECLPYWRGIFSDTNPPDIDHWMYKYFIENVNEEYTLIRQPPGLIKIGNVYETNPEAENLKNIGYDFYKNMVANNSEEHIRVYCMGDFGSIRNERVVFPEYNDDFHSCDDIIPDKLLPLYIGMDFGLTPAITVFQVTSDYRLMLLNEINTDRLSTESFVEDCLIPFLNLNYSGFSIKNIICDPSSMSGNEINDLSCISVLIKAGLPAIPAPTNLIEPRISSVKHFLNKNIMGKPSFLLDRTKCPMARRGFIAKYYYQRMMIINEERYKDIPHKNKWSHGQDSIQYVASVVYNEGNFRDKEDIARKVYNPIIWRNVQQRR
jgi:hypothetical protein